MITESFEVTPLTESLQSQCGLHKAFVPTKF